MSDPSSRFWSDDFDMDLPKVLPDVWEMIQRVPTVPLYTHGHRTHGRLNHPAVWNDYEGMVAYFGFGPMCGKPPHCVAGGEVVECTFAEACRDAWPHHYRLLLEGREVLNTWNLVRQFDVLMYDLRGWRDPLSPRERERAKSSVRRAFANGVHAFKTIFDLRGAAV